MKGFLLLPAILIAIILVSGCTIPGTDIEIPWFGGQQTVEYKDDIIIIKALDVTPGKEVKPGQALTLYADIQNLEEPRFGGEGIEVTVELYDYCTTLFSSVDVKCPEGSGLGAKCENIEMRPQEITSIEWVLTPKTDIKLKTPCTLKVKVTYHYETRVVTQITFIAENELNSRVRRGEPWRITGSSVIGYGPAKPYLVVESQQPVSDSENVWGYISLTIKNVGYGYVKNSQIEKNIEIEHENFLDMELAKEGGGTCKFEKTPIKLINKQSSPLLCRVKPSGVVEIEQTYDMEANIEYDYEFRKSVRVTVTP